jgi:VWFA-related protein
MPRPVRRHSQAAQYRATARFLSVFLLVALALPPSFAQQSSDEPIRLPSVQREEIKIHLLDVEAIDKDGNPLLGLTKDDFRLHIGDKLREIHSVDNFCACDQPAILAATTHRASVAGTAAITDETSGIDSNSWNHRTSTTRAVAASTKRPPSDRIRYVLYMDFSQLRLDGRLRAIQEAHRWVQETMPADGEAMIVAYSTASGLIDLVPFTDHREKLIEALKAAFSSRAWIDSFPEEIDDRLNQCKFFPGSCPAFAAKEYMHGRRSLLALRTTMQALEVFPGRKLVFVFHENGMMFPGHVYKVEFNDHMDLSGQIGAAANLARATVHSLNVGSLPLPGWCGSKSRLERIQDQAITLGLNLAEFTGGSHNRHHGDLPTIIDAASNECRCVYRLGIIPPDPIPPNILTARVIAAGWLQDFRYKVKFLSNGEHWLRKANLILRDPARATDVTVNAALIPLEANGRRWRVAARIAVDRETLFNMNSKGSRSREWEVGALFHRSDGTQVEELLGIYRQSSDDKKTGAHSAYLRKSIHEREILEVPSGSYRLSSFARDRHANSFGGAETRLNLPHPGKGGLAGPMIVRSARLHTVSALSRFKPTRREKLQWVSRRRSVVPVNPAAVQVGTSLEALTWICPGKKNKKPEKIDRYLDVPGRSALRIEKTELTRAGSCWRLSDTIDTSRLAPGTYTYHMAFGADGHGLEGMQGSVSFELIAASRN